MKKQRRYISPEVTDYPVQIGKLYKLKTKRIGKESYVLSINQNKIATFIEVLGEQVVMVVFIDEDPTRFVRCLLGGRLVEVSRKNLIPFEIEEETLNEE